MVGKIPSVKIPGRQTLHGKTYREPRGQRHDDQGSAVIFRSLWRILSRRTSALVWFDTGAEIEDVHKFQVEKIPSANPPNEDTDGKETRCYHGRQWIVMNRSS